MFLKSLRRVPKTVGFRLALWYSTIFILSSLVLFGLAYLLLSSSLKQRDRESIQTKLKELSAIYETRGLRDLEREVTVEKKFAKNDLFFVRVAERTNRTVFLNLPYQWVEFNIQKLEETTFNHPGKWIRVPAESDESFLEVAFIRLVDGSLLQVGKSTEDRDKTLEHFGEMFAAVLTPIVLFAFVGGALFATRALRPIRHLVETVHSVDTGRLEARVPSPQTGDELDELVTLFNRMLEKIERLINTMKAALDNVAHDLRTPMMRFRCSAEAALRSDQTREVYRDALADCVEESDQILRMLNTLMDISEAESGTVELHREPVDLSTLIEEVIEVYSYVGEEKGIALQNDAFTELSLTADPNRIRQIVANLLDNAIKYTPSGGKIQVQAYTNGSEVVLTVRDTGIGIPQGDLPRIWDRLYRGDQSRSEKGVGLGLSLVKAVVEAHKGRVEVVSEPGKGSSFMVFLPSKY